MRFRIILPLTALAVASGCSSAQSESTFTTVDGAIAEPAAPTSTTATPTSTTEALTPTPLASEASLLRAIPSARQLPAGWTDMGEAPITEFQPKTGTGFGYCGGPNGDQRALDANSTASAYQRWLAGSNRQLASVQLYAFDQEEDAATFMTSSERAVSSCGFEKLEVPEFVEGRDEGTTDYRIDIFIDTFEPEGQWALNESTSLGGAAAEGADESFSIRNNEEFRSTADGVTFGTTYGVISQYERHGTVVLVFNLRGQCCSYGFGNSGASEESALPVYDSLQQAADDLRPAILAAIFNNAES